MQKLVKHTHKEALDNSFEKKIFREVATGSLFFLTSIVGMRVAALQRWQRMAAIEVLFLWSVTE